MLILAATPIGNLADASLRLKQVLQDAQFIAAEDTRTLKQLASALGVQLQAKLFSLHEHSDQERIDHLVEIAASSDLVVVSDAGMPTISDPGYQLVRDCAAKDIEVISVPGPSAVISALAVSGLATDRFCFEGFLPRKSGERQRAFEDLIDERRTMIFFEAPHRILDSLEDASKVFGSDRRGSVSRELTKKFEHTERGSLDDLIAWARTEPKGEMVLVIEGAKPKVFDIRELGRQALELAATGVGLKQACNEIAQATGASKSAIYAEALSLKA